MKPADHALRSHRKRVAKWLSEGDRIEPLGFESGFAAGGIFEVSVLARLEAVERAIDRLGDRLEGMLR